MKSFIKVKVIVAFALGLSAQVHALEVDIEYALFMRGAGKDTIKLFDRNFYTLSAFGKKLIDADLIRYSGLSVGIIWRKFGIKLYGLSGDAISQGSVRIRFSDRIFGISPFYKMKLFSLKFDSSRRFILHFIPSVPVGYSSAVFEISDSITSKTDRDSSFIISPTAALRILFSQKTHNLAISFFADGGIGYTFSPAYKTLFGEAQFMGLSFSMNVGVGVGW